MKRNDSPSRRPFNPTESAPDFLGPIAPEVTTAPAFPSFPSFDELLTHARMGTRHPLELSETKPPSEPTSLFDGLLGGNLGALIQDASAHPERYDVATREFLEELAAGKHDVKKLPRREAELLAHAVLDFASFRPPPTSTAAPKRPPSPPQKKPALLREEDELPDGRESPADIPGDPMSAYWWL